jgi:gamma-glutamyl hercynylcysteine S-oxide synthase
MMIEGFLADSMPFLDDVDSLSSALRDAREYTLGLYAHLDDAGWQVPRLAIINPPLWELAHIAWFQEFWCLRQGIDGQRGLRAASLLSGADAMFDSGAVPHATRWNLPYPGRHTIFRYMHESFEATLEALAKSRDDERYFFRLSLLHEDMHGEAMLMTLHTLGLPAPSRSHGVAPAVAVEPSREVRFNGGEFLQGAIPESRHFVFDNEKWAHVVAVRPFSIDLAPVSNGDHVAFVEEGGYRRREFWTDAGWDWREKAQLRWPANWRRNGANWERRWFDAWSALGWGDPLVHVSCHEAEAFCAWAERRLPTEAEWEYAARNGGRDDRYPWGDALPGAIDGLDYRLAAPAAGAPHPAAPTGMKHVIGGVWEWTATSFLPYPGFRADPYKDYSEPWFGSHRALRGGSFATRSRLVHNRWRNFYLPGRNDLFAGFRTCAVEA